MKVSDTSTSAAAMRLIEQLAAANKDFEAAKAKPVKSPTEDGSAEAVKLQGKGAILDILC